MYTPNSGNELKRLAYRQSWDRDFLQYLKKLERKKPVVVETSEGDSIAIRPVGVLAQSFDHRAVDGAYAASFLRELKLVTVCEEAGCPNLSECWSDGTANGWCSGRCHWLLRGGRKGSGLIASANVATSWSRPWDAS